MAVLTFGVRLALGGALSAGQLSAFLLYALYVAGSAGSLMRLFSSVVQVGGWVGGWVGGGLM